MNTSRSTGLARLCRLKSHSEATDAEHAAMRERFAPLNDPGAAPRVVAAWNLFQTPEPIADRMAAMADLDGAGAILEPSAGLGRLYRAIRRRTDSWIMLVEQSPDCVAELYRATEGDGNVGLVQSDFLTWDGGRKFDRIVMNSPFQRGSDVTHIRRAMTLLDDDGLLVALCYNGTKQNAQLKPIADTWERLPAGSFASEGTRADVVLLTIRG